MSSTTCTDCSAFRDRGLGLDADILGAIFFDERRIVIDESLDPEENPSKEGRYRFTLAHEGGGHWRLHRHLFAKDPAQVSLFNEPAPPSVVCRSSQAKEPVEWQADFYASCLLMPRKLVMAAWDEMFPDRKPRIIQPRTPVEPSVRRDPARRMPIGALNAPRPTTICWTASPVRWPSSSLCRRSPCASGWRSLACSTARSRSSAPLPAAHSSFFEENVKCQLDRTNRAMAGNEAAFETRDFYLACFLRCTGYDLIALRPEGRRKVFVFRDRPTRRDDVLAFYRQGAAVPPLAFSATIKDMKALLHNA